jgi:F0F1-type ATP synthase assembly protein I
MQSRNKYIRCIVIAFDALLIMLAVSMFHGEKIGKSMMISFFCMWLSTTSQVWGYWIERGNTRLKQLAIIHYLIYVVIVLVTYGGLIH